MKRINFKSLVLILALVLSGISSFAAKVYYVCSGETFTIKAGEASATGMTYDWTGASLSSSVTTYNLVAIAPTITAGGAYQTLTYSLTVTENGCPSTPETFTVYVLPPIQVDITGADAVYCSDVAISDVLTATVLNPEVTDLPPGVAANVYAWTGTATGSAATLSITAAGTYDVTVSYSLPTNDGSKVGLCDATDELTITTTTPPTIPTISFE